MSEPPSKRRRVELSLEDKIKMIRESEMVPKPTIKILAEKYGVGKSTAGDILKKKATYRAHWENNVTANQRRFGYDTKYDSLNELVWQWFGNVRAKNLPISGPIIQEKARQFAEQLEIVDFKASNGWLEKWKTRHSIKEFKVSGESAGVDQDTVDGFKSRIPEVIEGYVLDDVFNCDETGLYFRALPDKTLSAKGSSNKGTKVSKDRVTVLFACSATGEKLKPLVIGKAENPRCFKNVNRSNLGIKYAHNKKAWMNGLIFKKWLTELNSDMRRRGRNILLLLDNASCHGKVEDYNFSNVNIKFLPANTTSHLQPLDQGIIRTFKAHYRKNLLRSLLCKMDSSDSVTQLCKQVTLLDSIGWIVKAWDSVKMECVVKCFQTVGFKDDAVAPVEFCEDDDDDVPLAVLVRECRFTAADVEELDRDAPTEDDTTTWEDNLVESFKDNTEPCTSDGESEEPEVPLPGSELTHSAVLDMLMKLKNFALVKDIDYLPNFDKLHTMTERKIVKVKCNWSKQSTLEIFLQKQ